MDPARPSVAGGSLGIDTLRLGGKSRRASARFGDGWRVLGNTDEDGTVKGTTFLRKLDCGASLQLIAGQDHEYGFVEFSAPKLAGSDNVVPLSLDEVRAVVPGVLEEARQYVEWRDPVQVNRLDVARDFTGVTEPGVLLLGLSSVPLPGRKVRDLYRDPAAGNAQTLFVRNTGGGCRLYDKHEESGKDEAIGRLRCEAQERRRGLRAQGVHLFADLSDELVYRVGRQRFDWAGFGRSVALFDECVTRVLASPDLTDGQRLQGLGALTLARAGQWHRVGNRWRRQRMRALLEVAGAFPLGSESAPATVYRLDYDCGLVAA